MTNKEAFAGLKVVDFSWVLVGPFATRCLADHGAFVVRVESMVKPDTLRVGGPYKDNLPGVDRSSFGTLAHPNKYGVSINLNHPRGQALAKRMVAWADVVGESFTPGTMAGWGLDYESLRQIKPDIIMYSTSMQGQTGPYRTFRGFGAQMAALAGYYHLTGWPDREPVGPFGAYSDFAAGLLMQTIVLAALDYRRRTGRGQHIDLSQLEASLHYLSPVLLDCAVNGRELERQGNRHTSACPHAAYPCQGEDRWCVIAVENENQWRSLCEVIGRPALAHDPRFATSARRKDLEEELDRVIGQWTFQHDASTVMSRLQEAGVPAGVVNRISDLFADPQLVHRQHFTTLEHREIGPHVYPTTAYRLSETPCLMQRAAPCLGQDNEYIFKEIMGLGDDELADLLADGALQ